MKLNSTTNTGFGIKGMAGYGAGAWNIGSAPISISSRERRNAKPAVRLQRETRTGNAARPVAASIARHRAGTEPQTWIALDLAVGLLLIACPLMMGL